MNLLEKTRGVCSKLWLAYLISTFAYHVCFLSIVNYCLYFIL